MSPIVLLLHGAGSNEHDLVGLVSGETAFEWVSLRAPFELEGGGATWFPARRPQPPDPLQVARSVQAVWSRLDDEEEPDRLIIPVGFSQGGFMATQLLLTRPARIAAGVILSGLMLEPPTQPTGQLTAATPPVFWGRGSHDPVVPAHGITHLRDFLTAHTTVEEHVYPELGHSVGTQEVADLTDFLRLRTQ